MNSLIVTCTQYKHTTFIFANEFKMGCIKRPKFLVCLNLQNDCVTIKFIYDAKLWLCMP